MPSPDNVSWVRAWGIDYRVTGGEDVELQKRDFESAISGVQEDCACAEAIQEEISALVETTFTHGCFEGVNVTIL